MQQQKDEMNKKKKSEDEDTMMKKVIRETIISSGASNNKTANVPDDILAFHRTVQNIDSSLDNPLCHLPRNVLSFEIDIIFTEDTIRHKFIAFDTPTRELLKEKNCVLEDMVNAMFLSPGLSHGMWRKAIISATYLLDKIPCKENKIVLMNYGCEEDYLIIYAHNSSAYGFFVSSRIDDEVVQDQRQRDDNYLQNERQDQPKEEEVELRRSKRARIEKSFGPDFVSFMV
nr:hypothetical protein [Tanacetum cinerariifolium]